MQKRNVLGRGLDALLDSISTEEPVATEGSSSINEIELSKITPNPHQPRREFDAAALEELSASIKQLGIIQPITLQQIDADHYQIIVGERRYRASVMAGLSTIPAYVRTVDDENIMTIALVENIQREDLNAIEIALAYQKILDQTQLTQEALSEQIGKKRTTITNYIRLLKLPAEIQLGLKNKQISMGHARALIPVEDPALQLEIFNQIIKHDLSVRKVEEVVREASEQKQPATADMPATAFEKEDLTILAEHLSNFFNSKVKLKCNDKGKGCITIPFSSEEDLERIMGVLDTLK